MAEPIMKLRLNSLLIVVCLLQITACQNPQLLATVNPAVAEPLAKTDGEGLLAKPAAITKTESDRLFALGKLACSTDCATPFGQELGQVDRVTAYSNCQSACIHPAYSFLDLNDSTVSIHTANPGDPNKHYIGLIYQCVEYARRWWMVNNRITFGDIHAAHEIIYLTEGKNIDTEDSFPLGRSINGSAKRAPKRGDLLIYYPKADDPLWRYGHVAVVVDVDLNQGVVSVAEENYNNLEWEAPTKYARQLQLINEQGRFRVLDKNPLSKTIYNNGVISGWVYPAGK